jgi:putative FmdB family regulatory protein
MPLFEFRCESCGLVQEKLMSFQDAITKAVHCPQCHVVTFRQQSAPGSVRVDGFNSVNGYSSARTITQRHGSVKTTVSGNFEAFADGLHK